LGALGDVFTLRSIQSIWFSACNNLECEQDVITAGVELPWFGVSAGRVREAARERAAVSSNQQTISIVQSRPRQNTIFDMVYHHQLHTEPTRDTEYADVDCAVNVWRTITTAPLQVNAVYPLHGSPSVDR
jgi:hypothetical protein